jgi:restriction system protein
MEIRRVSEPPLGCWTPHYRVRRALRELRNVSGTTTAAIVFLVLALALHSWILFVAFFVVVALKTMQWLYFRYFVQRSPVDEVDEMTGWEFERWLERFFTELGFEVERTPYRGDYGADFVLSWNGSRIAVQAKRSKQLIGLRAVQEVVAAKAYYRCDKAMVVTNGYFTDQALILGRSNGVFMRCRDDLTEKASGLHGIHDDVEAWAGEP